MTRLTVRGVRRLVGLFVPAAAAVVVGTQVPSGAQPASSAPAGITPGASTESLFTLGLKFEGAGSCADANCHGAKQPDPKGPPYYDEYAAWKKGKKGADGKPQAADPHSIAYKSLIKGNAKGDKGVKIFEAYKALNASAGASAETSAKCLTCHALAAPANLQGQNFNVQEGVTCGSCHGPSQKWNDPHAKKAAGGVWWAEAERKATGSTAAFVQKWGFYDTKDQQARADKCTSCHLAIDPQMVAAGHPQPHFELYYYSSNDMYTSRHWRQEEGYNAVKLWSIGQAASLRDAMHQLAERASGNASDEQLKTAYDQAMAHYEVFNALFTQKAVAAPAGRDPSQMAGWAKNLQANMAAKKKADVAKAAQQIEGWAVALTPAVKAISPTKATTLALMNEIAGQDKTVTDFGEIGAEQQRGALYAQWTAISTAADKPDKATSDKVFDQIFNLYPPEGKTTVDPAAYGKGLAGVKGALPK